MISRFFYLACVTVLGAFFIFGVVACSKIKEVEKAVVEKTAQKMLESATGAKVDRKDGEISVSLGEKEDSRSLSVSAKSAEKNGSIPNALILPEASLLSNIKGISDHTLHLKTNASLKEVETGYAGIFSKKGYKDNGSYILNGLYAGRWKNPESGEETIIYAYNDGEATHLTVVYPNNL
ncbi:hypothetical protein MNBD_NITROSPINAE04-1364 [hydrothermal vent metagenome]|uniref:Lipoprotein n=1 Tax=hydrothermal vent metagenome TaxID=652676 RepID=A0A3B1BTR7_9ZZZZ